MKKYDIIWVMWEFNKLGIGIQIFGDFREPNLSLGRRSIHTIALCTKVSAINNQRAIQMIIAENDKKELVCIDQLLESTFAPAAKLGFICIDSKAYWLLQKNESVTDGAIRISGLIFKLINLRAYSFSQLFSGDFERPLSEWTINKLRSVFSVRKHTMFEKNGVLEGIEINLREKHGLPEVD